MRGIIWVMLALSLAAAGVQRLVFLQGGVVKTGGVGAGRTAIPWSSFAIFGSDLASRVVQASTIPLST